MLNNFISAKLASKILGEYERTLLLNTRLEISIIKLIIIIEPIITYFIHTDYLPPFCLKYIALI